jgi:hypothetical protein
MRRRAISQEVAVHVIAHPDQQIIDRENPGTMIVQSLIKEGEQVFLLRVFISTNRYPNVVITLYKTTKIHKYYEGKI